VRYGIRKAGGTDIFRELDSLKRCYGLDSSLSFLYGTHTTSWSMLANHKVYPHAADLFGSEEQSKDRIRVRFT